MAQEHTISTGKSRESAMRVHLFGGVSATDENGSDVDLGPAKCQAVFAVLALSAGSAVPVSQIVEMVWGENPPRTADKTLQSYVTRLRKGLGGDTIVRVGAAYRLEMLADAVDVARFRRLMRDGDIDGALSEWSGVPLAGLELGALQATVDGLVEQWLATVEVDLEQRIDTDPPSVIGTLTELTALYPFREGLWALQMTALYRAGRQAEALAVYRTARQHLVEELGIEPGPRLRELESAVLGQDERLRARHSSTGANVTIPTGTVTFAFSDVDDATRMWSTSREQMASAMDRHDALFKAATHQHDGHIFSEGGDSFGVAFHRASDAVAWAGELQAEFSSEPWPGDLSIQLRIGIHTGEPEERRSGYFGPAVHLATQLMSAAQGEQTLVSAATSALAERTPLTELGTYRLEGAVSDQQVFQLGDFKFPPLRTEESQRGNLPRRTSRLIGRQGAVTLVGEAIEESPIVTLVGPGGIGKTRLALAAGRLEEDTFTGGAWLVELAGISSSSDVPRAVADTLDVQESPDRSLTQSITSALKLRHLLVVLDNCEHVVDGAAQLAQAIADACPSVRVLATSREGLGVRDERLIVVAPLEPSGPAVDLFVERAATASATFDPTASHSEIVEVCRRLDGVPLAIELAAARASSLSPADLVARLDDRLRLLTSGRRSTVERHRTLRATIQWSYDLLTPPEQLLFQRLSIFAGTFDLEAAESIAAQDTDSDVDDLLGGLVDQSMLIVESGQFGRGFRLLETIRQFGADLLSQSGQTDLIGERHSEWCLSEVASIHQLLTGNDEAQGVARLNQHWANLRAAFEWACSTNNAHLAHQLFSPVAMEIALRSQTEIGDWAERILALATPDDEELIVFGLCWSAYRYMLSHDHDAYERLAHRYGEPDHPLVRHARAVAFDIDEDLIKYAPAAIAYLRERGDDHVAELFLISSLVGPLSALGRFEEHDELVTELAQRFRIQGPPTFLHWTLFMLGYSATLQGNHEQAERLFRESAGVDIPDGTISLSKPIEARAALQHGSPIRACQILQSHIDELLDSDNLVVGGFACAEFVNTMATLDHLPEAARILGYLETASAFGQLSSRAFAATAANRIAARNQSVSDQDRQLGRELTAREALIYMRDTLGQLLTTPPQR